MSDGYLMLVRLKHKLLKLQERKTEYQNTSLRNTEKDFNV